MNKLFAILIVGLLLTVFISGCTENQNQTKINSQKEAQTTLRNISSDVGGVEDTLADIDSDLSGR